MHSVNKNNDNNNNDNNKEKNNNNNLPTLKTIILGDAKEWFNSWNPLQKTWEDFKQQLSSLYPAKRNLSERLRRVSLFTSDDADSFCAYARKKISLLNALDFDLSDNQIIEIVIGDIKDIHVKTAAFNSKVDSVADLLSLLGNYEKRPKFDTYLDKPTRKRQLPVYAEPNLRSRSSVCYTCNESGHISRHCPKKRKSIPSSVNTDSQRDAKPDFRSLGNKTNDVKANKYCEYCKKRGHLEADCFIKQRNQSPAPSTSKINHFCADLDKDFCTEFSIQNLKVKCLVDTGADCSLISENAVKKLNCHLEPTLVTLKGIGNATLFASSKAKLRVEKDGTAFEIVFYVVDSSAMLPDAILGRDLFRHKGIKIYTDWTGTRLILNETSLNTINHMKGPFETLHTPLEDNDLQNLISLLLKYKSNITIGNSVSPINTAEMKIRLKEDKIIHFHPYRMAVCERQKVKSIVQDLLKNNIIRESHSPFASPIVLVHKKDGSSRLCVDYRALNKITVKERYPLPLIQDQLDNLKCHKYFSSLDMASGFHQIPIAEDSIEKTAFVTPDGHYEYLRMPFGLSNAPAVFQRAICKALGDLKDKDALVYLDDILIPSHSVLDGLNKLDRVLNALTTAGFSLNIKKCYFFEKSIEYLGQEISEDGIRPGRRKVEALINTSDPKNVKQVRQFMGLCNYFRKFIPELSARTECITKLTQNNVKFVWGDEQKKAKAYVCDFLSRRPLLMFFDPNLPTELHTDASALGFGAVLFQRDSDKQLKVVAYFSKKTSKEESNYHSYELETLAAYYAIKHFRVYLLGIQFKLITDCNSLKLSQNKKDLIPRVARWWLYLQSFNFEIEYRKGKYIQHADYFSRNPVESPELQEQNKITQSINVLSTDNWLRKAQKQDLETQEIKQRLLEGKLTHEYFVQNDILFRKINPTQNPAVYRAFVPKGSRLGLLKLFHDEQCHVGPDKTFAKVNHYFWFPKMTKFVKKYCSRCLKCIVNKKHTGAKQSKLHPIDKKPVPFLIVHADCVGPFPVSADGFKHILLLVDAFTKYLFLIPLKTLSGSETSDALKLYLSMFSLTKTLISDRGTNFTDKSVKDVLKNLGINHHLIAKSAPRGNGQVERYVSTVLDLLRTEIDNTNKSEWPSLLSKLQTTLNTTIQKTTGFTPLYLLIGAESSIPDIRTLTESIIETKISENLENDRKLAYGRIRKQAEYEKALFDKSRIPNKDISIGDMVFHPSGDSHLAKLDAR